MAKITRVNQKVFGGSSANNGQFGSAQTGAKLKSNDPSVIMGLAAWAAGWASATTGGTQLPTLEEMQGVSYVITSQIAYLLQEGIAEYDSATPYFAKSIVKKVGTYQIFGSVTDNNSGNALTDASKWVPLVDLSNISASVALPLAIATPTNATQVVITGLDFTTFRSMSVDINSLLPVTDGSYLRMQVSTDGGTTWIAGTNYEWVVTASSGAVVATATDNATDRLVMANSTVAGYDNVKPAGIRLRLLNGSGPTKEMLFDGMHARSDNGNITLIHGAGRVTTTNPINALRFDMSAGNIASGSFVLRGNR